MGTRDPHSSSEPVIRVHENKGYGQSPEKDPWRSLGPFPTNDDELDVDDFGIGTEGAHSGSIPQVLHLSLQPHDRHILLPRPHCQPTDLSARPI